MEKVTKEQIAAWKKEHGTVIEFTDPESKQKIYLRKPTRKEISFALTEAQHNPLGLVEVILDNCWLAGDDKLKQNDDFVLGVNSRIDEIVTIKMLEVKKY